MDRVSLGFVLAALYNSGIVLISKGFGEDLGAIDPFFSPAGCCMILLWGAAYLALAPCYRSAHGVAAVFCAEKAFFVVRWILWLHAEGDSLPSLFAEDWLTAFFFSIYGLGDAVFMVFFFWVAWRWRTRPTRAV